jgi:hypothetical protein
MDFKGVAWHNSSNEKSPRNVRGQKVLKNLTNGLPDIFMVIVQKAS